VDQNPAYCQPSFVFGMARAMLCAASCSPLQAFPQQAPANETSMRIIETLPEAPAAYIISSMINLVCPRCGGRMMEFQCYGKCRKNWFTEWQRAHNETQNLG
jgi:hypothetical protein